MESDSVGLLLSRGLMLLFYGCLFLVTSHPNEAVPNQMVIKKVCIDEFIKAAACWRETVGIFTLNMMHSSNQTTIQQHDCFKVMTGSEASVVVSKHLFSAARRETRQETQNMNNSGTT